MRRNRPLQTDGEDRAVSEVLSFVLVFGIILTGVAVLSMTGFQAMEDYQDTEQLRNGERAMDALADNFNDVLRYNGIDQRYGELSLRDGTVTTGNDGTKITIRVGEEGEEEEEKENVKEDWFDQNGDAFNLGEFAYHYNDETIAYEGGGVIRSDETGSVVQKEPQFRCRDGTAVISLVMIDADDRSIQSSGGVGFTMTVQDRVTETKDFQEEEEQIDVSMSVDSEYDAWDDWNCDDVERVHVTIVTVDIDY